MSERVSDSAHINKTTEEVNKFMPKNDTRCVVRASDSRFGFCWRVDIRRADLKHRLKLISRISSKDGGIGDIASGTIDRSRDLRPASSGRCNTIMRLSYVNCSDRACRLCIFSFVEEKVDRSLSLSNERCDGKFCCHFSKAWLASATIFCWEQRSMLCEVRIPYMSSRSGDAILYTKLSWHWYVDRQICVACKRGSKWTFSKISDGV